MCRHFTTTLPEERSSYLFPAVNSEANWHIKWQSESNVDFRGYNELYQTDNDTGSYPQKRKGYIPDEELVEECSDESETEEVDEETSSELEEIDSSEPLQKEQNFAPVFLVWVNRTALLTNLETLSQILGSDQRLEKAVSRINTEGEVDVNEIEAEFPTTENFLEPIVDEHYFCTSVELKQNHKAITSKNKSSKIKKFASY